MKKVFRESLTLDDALNLLRQSLHDHNVGHTDSESVAVKKARGRITAEAVFARCSSPAYHSSAMDGYAVRFRDTFGASETKPLVLEMGSGAVSVDTGDPLPPGFDAVIMMEDVNVAGNGIEIYASVTPYQHVRVIGEDIVATELIIPENHAVRPVDAGALLASGRLDIQVRRKPRVAVIPTGTELIDAETVRVRAPEAPEIIEYNATLLGGMAEEYGAEPLGVPIVADDAASIRKALLGALESSDIVIINAGSGKGTEDYTAAVIAEFGELIIHSVAIKPGKPVIFGMVQGKPVFGIPGYPVSAYLTMRLFVRPVIAHLLGVAVEEDETASAILSRQISSPLGVDEFVRVKVGAVGEKLIATPVGRGAGLLMSVVRADGFLKVPADSEGIPSGAPVTIQLLRSREAIKNTIVCIGSHDNALDLLANRIKQRCPRLSLSSAHVGSMGGLMALKRGEAHIAGTHLLDEETGDYNVPYLKQLLADRPTVLVNLVYRRQGLLVKPGNPKNITDFTDLARKDVVFINRQSGSGTRLLLDKHLRDLGIRTADIAGYKREEYTHMAVASAVLTGLADAGLAVYSSAQALGLDFIPVADERYDIAIAADVFESEKIRILMGIIGDDAEFRTGVENLGGYDTRDMGKVLFRV
ncbi:MAG TPA: molybdopterin biosynthesis protein [Dissulfurispiraceae bacterium]|nr:molybdopterin biosynthesis protein [Dissulfurispiraceae bacterium]